MKPKYLLKFLVKFLGVIISLFIAILWSTPSQAWNPIGHRLASETASLLIAEEPTLADWGAFLARHRFQLGVYSNIPDSIFRYRDGEDGSREGPTHVFALDVLFSEKDLLKPGDAILDNIPRIHAEAREKITAKNGDSAWHKLGSAPWRVEQFMQLAWSELKNLKSLEGGYTSGEAAASEAKNVYRALYYLGLMSHFAADATVPHHATSDFNGYSKGQGGIHFYFEGDCVNHFDPELSEKVLKAARVEMKLRKSKSKSASRTSTSAHDTPAGFMMEVFLDSYRTLPKLMNIDLKNAIQEASPKDGSRFAKRFPQARSCAAMKDLVILQLAKASVVTALLWEEVLPRTVSFDKAKSLQFADWIQNAEFVEPNYKAPMIPPPPIPTSWLFSQ